MFIDSSWSSPSWKKMITLYVYIYMLVYMSITSTGTWFLHILQKFQGPSPFTALLTSAEGGVERNLSGISWFLIPWFLSEILIVVYIQYIEVLCNSEVQRSEVDVKRGCRKNPGAWEIHGHEATCLFTRVATQSVLGHPCEPVDIDIWEKNMFRFGIMPNCIASWRLPLF